MNKSRYILLLSIIIIIIAIVFRVQERIIDQNLKTKIELNNPTPTTNNVINKDILLEKDIPPKEVVKKTPTVVPVVARDPNAISAEAYLIGDLDTGKVYLQFNSNKVYPIASLSKLFTALVSRHVLDQEKNLTVTEEILKTNGDAGHLVKDEIFTAEELLYPLLMESSNDAAEVLAQSFGYTDFINQMNSLASELGMTSTKFKDASGLNSQNISNAKDLFTLALYLYKYEPTLLEITKQKEFDLATTTEHQSHHFVSINPFVVYTHFIGGKTGRTSEAKESMVSLFTYPENVTIRNIAVISLRSDFGEREMDTEKLIEKFLNGVK